MLYVAALLSSLQLPSILFSFYSAADCLAHLQLRPQSMAWQLWQRKCVCDSLTAARCWPRCEWKPPQPPQPPQPTAFLPPQHFSSGFWAKIRYGESSASYIVIICPCLVGRIGQEFHRLQEKYFLLLFSICLQIIFMLWSFPSFIYFFLTDTRTGTQHAPRTGGRTGGGGKGLATHPGCEQQRASQGLTTGFTQEEAKQ